MEIAACAHAGAPDKAGNPYILHPLRVMLRVSTHTERIVAVLHDVVEDTPVTLDELRREGFSDEIIAAVELLTKRQGESRMDAARRLAPNRIARRVKLADVADNMDLTRIAHPTDRDHSRIREYEDVRRFLESFGD